MKKAKRWLTVLLCLGLLAGLCAACTVPEPADSSVDSGEILPRKLTAAEKETVQAYLNAAENNGFISPLGYYSRPEEVSLYEVFYSSSPVVEGKERELCLQAGVGFKYAPLFKVTPALAETTVQEKLGISLADVVNGMQGFSYLESTDAYYMHHTDSNYCPVTVTGGAVTREGLYAVHYYQTNDRSQTATVTLRRTETGYQFVSNLPDEGSSLTTSTTTEMTTTTTSTARELTAAEKQELEDYLNATENNGLVGCQYATPQDVPLDWMFYDGAGIGSWDMSAWSEEEKQALLAHPGWEEFYVGVMKLPASAVAATVEEKLGIPLSAVSQGLDYHYLEEYDAYYTMHSDTNMLRVTVTGGRVAGQDYIVEYIADSEESFTVVLRRTENGYQFVSNLPNTKP